MKLSVLKNHLTGLNAVNFQLPDGTFVPQHFHVTEVGIVSKNFIDCGGTVRSEQVVNFQLWEARDFDHRIAPEKLAQIIALSERTLGIEDFEIEVEYQTGTIGKYHLDFDGTNFQLLNTKTACLASDNCGIPAEKQKIALATLGNDEASCCTPGGNCC